MIIGQGTPKQAVCSCGWKGTEFEGPGLIGLSAQREGRVHLDQVGGGFITPVGSE